MIQGIDVSHHQGHIDWEEVARGTTKFAVVKATEGMTSEDTAFLYNVRTAKRVGLLVGAYHFAHPERNSPHFEARNFVDHVFHQPVDFYVLDIEVSGGSAIADWCRVWLATVEKDTGKLPFIYSGLSYTKDNLNYQPLSRYPLWVAAYRKTPPAAPKPWHEWAIWQYTSEGSVAGIKGNVDLNHAKDNAFNDRVLGRETEVDQATGDAILSELKLLNAKLETGNDEHGQPRGPIGGLMARVAQKTDVQGLDLGAVKDGLKQLGANINR